MTEPSDSNFDVDSVDDVNWSQLFNATHTWGDSMTEYPHKQHIRFFLQNCRIPVPDPARVTMYKDMLSLNADVIGLAKTPTTAGIMNKDTRVT